VAVTLESGSEYVYANNTNKSTDLAETQNDSQITVKQNDSTEEQYIIIDSGDGESALVVTEKLPRIRGVVIVASGANNEQIRQAIVNSVTTALDISSRKVYVTNAN
jgi:stage III sporulation protein AG